ncbi:MAG: amidase [Sediminibacterium sp.]|jgi:Asp-tRNA(Asn)/Glu-tRNA(Gln) amidotransferase A subunit family amidase|nr:MAG: amidase [Sediminibacterium sp.]
MRIIFTSLLLSFGLLVSAQDTSIQKKDLISASKLFDLSFTTKEIDTLYSDVVDNLANYKAMHNLPLANSIPLSMWQTPVVPGMHFNTVQKPVLWKLDNTIQLPANKNDLAFYTLEQLASLIKNKKISSLALTQFFIDRIKKWGDTLQCVISIQEDIAYAQAKKADAELAQGKYRGLLHGIPYGLKDLFAVKGTKTTWGAAPYQNQTIDEDAFVYTKLKEAGAVLVAKFTLGALAMGDYWFGGRTKNPWNLKYGSSGSSAGSTSATVAGLVPFAIGTETWGSIVSPSTTCGATGLRPTFGSVSRSGAMALSYSLDKVGPICRSAADAAIVFNYIHGTDGKDGSAVNMPFNFTPNKDIKKLKIAYAKNYFDKIKDTSRNEFKVLEEFRKLGVQLIPVNFPDSGVYTFNIMDVVIGAECAAQFDEMTRKNIDDALTRQTKSDWPNSFRTNRFIPAVEYINAQRHRYTLMQKVNEVMQQYDVIICPSRGDGNQSAITNLTGNPVVCVPTGFDKKLNLPTGISFVGNLYDEATILSIAEAYQKATNWDETHPVLFK